MTPYSKKATELLRKPNTDCHSGLSSAGVPQQKGKYGANKLREKENERRLNISITTILFDLDGTLLPMDQDIFAKAYLKGLTTAAEPAGHSPMILGTAIMAGTAAMVKNNGEKTNEEMFWDTLEKTYDESVKNDIHLFDGFYITDFQKIKNICGFEPKAAKLIRHIKEKDFRVVLAEILVFKVFYKKKA